MNGPLARPHARVAPSTALLITAFVLGNAAMGVSVTERATSPARVLAVFAVVLLIFARHRWTSALRRSDGSRSRRELVAVLLATIGLEAVTCFQLGGAAFTAWCAVVVFDVLRTRHFFARDWFRRRRELYAVLSCAGAVFLGAFVIAGSVRAPVTELGAVGWGLSAANWSLSCIFALAGGAFTRDTRESRARSSRLSPAGVALVCAGLVLIANSLLLLAPLPSTALIIGASAVSIVVALFYACEPRLDRAIIFRVTMTGFFLGFYAGLASTPLLS